LWFTHRGIEKLFEGRRLMDGGELAGVVTGDSAFAHSLAYCLAVESLADFAAPPVLQHWRALLLELERIVNHMADCAAIVHDMAFDALSSPLTVVQEQAVRLAQELTGNRLLRGVNRPGGMVLPAEAQAALPGLAGRIEELVDGFLDLALPVMQEPACRDRLIATGVLTRREALSLGATGLPTRASGVLARDFRLRHPWGIYCDVNIRKRIKGIAQEPLDLTRLNEPQPDAIDWTRRVPVRKQPKLRKERETHEEDPGLKEPATIDLTGDVFARTWLRLAELEACRDLMEPIVAGLVDAPPLAAPAPGSAADIEAALRDAENFDFGIGCVEAWRGEVCYWVQKGPRGSIYRCKVRDPSVFNWPALAQAVVCKNRQDGEPGAGLRHENILADFPLINKSFNLSYAGSDL
ncbi:MAG TPA: hypothetical protein VES73_13175, partial [Lamprocystis sp. (in: g-proteobacteria)]|nr:hypothetical protein [Lamprocystis sp. (in: g-proteobacteria)]